MALDVFFRPAVDGPALAGEASVQRYWSVQHTLLRRRVVQLTYQHEATDVVFTVDREAADLAPGVADLSPFCARLNVARPDFYGREAVHALDQLAKSVGTMLVCGRADEELAETDDESLLDLWRSLNTQAWQVVDETGALFVRIDRDVADEWWAWQNALADRQDQVEDRDLFLPTVLLLRHAGSDQVRRMWTWTEGQAQAIPSADAVFYIADLSVSGPQVVLSQAAVLTVVEDLIATVHVSDGASIRHIPYEYDGESRRRAADLVAKLPPSEPPDFELVGTEFLRDQ